MAPRTPLVTPPIAYAPLGPRTATIQTPATSATTMDPAFGLPAELTQAR
jgi:hypothetical protein